MIKISDVANPNYLAKVVKLENLRKHEGADRLQMTTINFNDVVLGLEAEIGMVYIYFPIEAQINFEFLKENNSFDSQLLNKDPNVKGYFNKQGRVKAVKLRGERSMGVLFPVESFKNFINLKGISLNDFFNEHLNEEFDTINDVLMVKKYQVPIKNSGMENKLGKKPRISRLVDNQVFLHVDTTNLRNEAYKIKPDDFISVTNKLHGTSFHVHNVIVKRKLNVFSKLLKSLGVKIQETEYDLVFGSRKVIKNEYETQHVNDFYDGDLYSEIKEELREFVPKNYNVYGECVGYTKSGGAIQKDYTYGCKEGEHKLFIYRITIVNPDGNVTELSTLQIKEFCDKKGLNYVPLYYVGYAKNLYPDLNVEDHWNEEFVKRLEKDYATGDCDICVGVPKEGIVLRVEGLSYFESYKLKNFDFLQRESLELDAGVIDLESAN